MEKGRVQGGASCRSRAEEGGSDALGYDESQRNAGRQSG